jgi:REP element-mobilizing transposase RayT
MFRISKDSPVHYLTSVTNNRLPVFKTASFKDLVCEALNEARTSAGLLLFAYVVMPDHLHALIGSPRKPSEVLRYVNGISGHRVISSLKEGRYDRRWRSSNTRQGAASQVRGSFPERHSLAARNAAKPRP